MSKYCNQTSQYTNLLSWQIFFEGKIKFESHQQNQNLYQKGKNQEKE